LRVEACGAELAETVAIVGGRLSDRKGVNVPGVALPITALTDKDRADLTFALDLGVDWLALSFVQRPEDVAEGRDLVAGRAGILVKLEKPLAIESLEGIVELADAVMVARGDLGVEMPPEDVPPIQKQIIQACRMAGKPVIVATQMLESMTASATPTRAEASDVATAIYEGTDAVMLSAESASGAYPVEAVEMMNRIICRVERDPFYRALTEAGQLVPERTPSDAISKAARQVAQTIGAAAIVSYTTSGATALRAARERPEVPILVLTSNLNTARRLSLLWGAHCVHTRDVSSVSEMVERAVTVAQHDGLAKTAETVVITAGIPFGTPGATNALRIARLG
jgi:pyruvate kinase